MLANTARCVSVEIPRSSPIAITLLIPKFVEYLANSIIFYSNGADNGNVKVIAARWNNGYHGC